MKELQNVPGPNEIRIWIAIMKDGSKSRVQGRLWFDARAEAYRIYGERLDSVVIAPEREQPNGSQ